MPSLGGAMDLQNSPLQLVRNIVYTLCFEADVTLFVSIVQKHNVFRHGAYTRSISVALGNRIYASSGPTTWPISFPNLPLFSPPSLWHRLL
ncbi:hypothetical protein TRIATDRAFT_301929 [Trichoderma atroviride IMI 206040]|uniref:Uncharacterized protein n=1 Tax=Hypocrea atroviridis (strain ATCC 20476 / IMI 206040) TaxID=452589 RepID=G9P5P9_HYPAI|nr:uncharacterized protein TRIATDRAFT_301929 [Trichoderma atroviride IMI 206040]EHK41341.1 hypothetical protein TRIATDRAFT_301929 [Trichoderma atroviride IMI 206040]